MQRFDWISMQRIAPLPVCSFIPWFSWLSLATSPDQSQPSPIWSDQSWRLDYEYNQPENKNVCVSVFTHQAASFLSDLSPSSHLHLSLYSFITQIHHHTVSLPLPHYYNSLSQFQCLSVLLSPGLISCTQSLSLSPLSWSFLLLYVEYHIFSLHLWEILTRCFTHVAWYCGKCFYPLSFRWFCVDYNCQ